MKKYEVEVREECGGRETLTIDAESLDEVMTAADTSCREWVADGEYGIDGASVSAWWRLVGDDDWVGVTVEIEPDEDAQMSADGVPDDHEHDWTSEGEGGCAENPGVWSTGGTSMLFASHCRVCGCHRRETTTGSQHNPGDHDTTTYIMPDRWCAECQSDDCEH